MPKSNKINSRNKRAREAKSASQNTVAANQTSNTINPPPNVPPTELLTNQNLQNSPASAAALPHLQQINSSSTNANIYTSHSEAMDTSHSVSPQTSQPAALQINSSSSPQTGTMDISNPVSPQASQLGLQINSSTSSSSSSQPGPVDISESETIEDKAIKALSGYIRIHVGEVIKARCVAMLETL